MSVTFHEQVRKSPVGDCADVLPPDVSSERSIYRLNVSLERATADGQWWVMQIWTHFTKIFRMTSQRSFYPFELKIVDGQTGRAGFDLVWWKRMLQYFLSDECYMQGILLVTIMMVSSCIEILYNWRTYLIGYLKILILI